MKELRLVKEILSFSCISVVSISLYRLFIICRLQYKVNAVKPTPVQMTPVGGKSGGRAERVADECKAELGDLSQQLGLCFQDIL